MAPRCDGQENEVCGVGMIATVKRQVKTGYCERPRNGGEDTYDGARAGHMFDTMGTLDEGGLHP